MNWPSLIAVLFLSLIVGAMIIAMVLLFRDKTNSHALSELSRAREQAQERADRLTEALARKSGIDLILPAGKLPEALEKSPGWFDSKPHARITAANGKEIKQ